MAKAEMEKYYVGVEACIRKRAVRRAKMVDEPYFYGNSTSPAPQIAQSLLI